ncbi:Signal peptidase complex subunit 3A, partial [Tetrabaena socialis]
MFSAKAVYGNSARLRDGKVQTMHSIWHRANSSLTFFGTVAAVLCLLTTGTDFFHESNPSVSLKLHDVRRLVQHHGSKEHAVVTFDLDADLRDVFSWNTKQLFAFVQAEYETPENRINQVVLWDSIIQQKPPRPPPPPLLRRGDKAYIRLNAHKTKYAFIEPGRYLRNREVNLTLVWCVMPRVGAMYTQQRVLPAGKLP